MMLFGIVFLQYFSTMPLYYKDEHHLSEFEIGILLMGYEWFYHFCIRNAFSKMVRKT